MSEAYSDITPDLKSLMLPEAGRILNDCLKLEIVFKNHIGESQADLLARYTGAAVESLFIDNTQDGVDGVVDFFMNASVEASVTREIDANLLITAHDIAQRYKPSKMIAESLLALELKACWTTLAIKTAHNLLERNLTYTELEDVGMTVQRHHSARTISGSFFPH